MPQPHAILMPHNHSGTAPARPISSKSVTPNATKAAVAKVTAARCWRVERGVRHAITAATTHHNPASTALNVLYQSMRLATRTAEEIPPGLLRSLTLPARLARLQCQLVQ